MIEQGVITPQDFVFNNINYLTLMGSRAYGTNSDSSDVDIYGFCTPPHELLYPYAWSRKLYGFGTKPKTFDGYHQSVDYNGMKYDINIYSIVRYFDMLLKSTPNIIDSVFTPYDCVLFIDNAGKHVRDNAHRFLSKECYPKFKGYSLGQLEAAEKGGKRRTKALMASARNAIMLESIFAGLPVDLRRPKDFLLGIKNGEYSLEQVIEIVEFFLENVEVLKETTTLPERLDESEIESILLASLSFSLTGKGIVI